MTGGTFYRTYASLPGWAQTQCAPNCGDLADGGAVLAGDGSAGDSDPATVSDFRLDKYLVTVGRFRQFVNAVLPADGGAGWLPPPGSGKHSHLNGGSGLRATAGGFEPGWVATADDRNISPSDSNLPECTWTSTPAGQENLPMNCASWYQAYAFCIWDSGFLPSDAEFEYAAAGGNEERWYPWGSTDPGTSNAYAIYGHYFNVSGGLAPASVGTAALGAGLWGQLDLVGDVREWNLDTYGAYANPCIDCANTTNTEAPKVLRGEQWFQSPCYPSSFRDLESPGDRQGINGFRCARTP